MSLLEWDVSYETGYELIDRQHRELILLLDELAHLDSCSFEERKVLSVFDRLTGFTLSHFDAEEDLMARVGYPQRDQAEMIEQHRDFMAYVRLAVLDMRAGHLEHDAAFRHLAERLALVEFESGKRLAAYIRRMRTSPPARA